MFILSEWSKGHTSMYALVIQYRFNSEIVLFLLRAHLNMTDRGWMCLVMG
jgi:hypothetical protein